MTPKIGYLEASGEALDPNLDPEASKVGFERPLSHSEAPGPGAFHPGRGHRLDIY